MHKGMKAEIIIGLIVLAAVGFVIIFFSIYLHNKSPLEESKVELPSTETQGNDIQTSNFTRLVSAGQNICEGCHLSGKTYIPQAYDVKQHVEGGAYCLKCHKIDHKTHPINNNVTCEGCHGTTSPQVPEFRNGTIVCAQCHDFPDPLKPSNGNLIVIHRPRNVDCISCHLDSSESCLKCHNEIKNNTKWETRLNHFQYTSEDNAITSFAPTFIWL
jgi:hypothetical protein